MTITQTIVALEKIKDKYGDLQIYDVHYGCTVELTELEPTVIKTSLSKDYVVIFQYKDDE